MRQWGWLLGILGAFSAQAAVIEFDLTDLGGGRWQSDYTLINDGADPVEGFLIEFPAGLYANLTLSGQPGGWDSFTADPLPPPFPAPGLLDSLATGGGLASGASLSGWQVAFDYTGSGQPGPLAFQIYDPVSFATLETGMTRRGQPNQVPEPPSWAVCLVAWLSVWGAGVARRGNKRSLFMREGG